MEMISRDTLQKLAEALRDVLTNRQIIVLCEKLEDIEGDKSFRDSVEALVEELKRRKK